MKTSAIVAKAVSRLFIILLLVAVIILFRVDHNKLQHIYFTGKSKWSFVFPGILVLSFIILFVYCTVNKYSKTDWNWVLVLNTAILMAYFATLYMRIYELVSH
ncbi:MAG TPA: hypothetical protein VHB54_15540 [Mucilaginibacter sp.]|nr:hypothetical protein [Mucilaginibacter sp.]